MPADVDFDREFDELAALLREDRPEVDPFFARELDAKVAAGFPREPRWRRLFRVHPMMVPGVAASMLLAVVVSAALLADRGGDEGPASGGGGEMAAPAISDDSTAGGADENAASQATRPYSEERAKGEPADSSASLAPAAASPPVPGGGSVKADGRQGRKVETSAALLLGAKPGQVQRVADEVVAVTDRHRGFVLRSSVDTVQDGGGAQFELRVPSERLKPALADLSRIGDVRERREASEDITQAFVSARSRLADARAERRGLLRQLARAVTDAERESVKQRLRDVGARIAAAKTDLARVNNRASYSNIAVTVVGDPAAGASSGDGTWTPGDAAKDAIRVLEVAAGVLLIALAVGLPLALIGALALLLARLTQRRRRERLLDTV